MTNSAPTAVTIRPRRRPDRRLAALLMLLGVGLLAFTRLGPAAADPGQVPAALVGAPGSAISSAAVPVAAQWRLDQPDAAFDGLPAEGAVDATWDGDALYVTWLGEVATLDTGNNFWGDRRIVPGDRLERTLNLRNTSGSTAMLSVTILPHTAAKSLAAEDAAKTPLEDAVEVFWNVAGKRGSATVAELRSRDRVLTAKLRVEPDEVVPVTIGFSYDAAITDRLSATHRSLPWGFGLKVQLTGGTGSGPADPPAPRVATGGSILPEPGSALAAALGILGAGLFAAGSAWWLAAGYRRDPEYVTVERVIDDE